MQASNKSDGTLSRVKANGVHYTPPELAKFLAHVAINALELRDGDVEVLDPACGDGGLLLALVESTPENMRSRLVLTGYETDVSELEKARRALSRCGASRATLIAQDFLSVDGVENDFASEPRGLFDDELPSAKRFDLVIANPPYVRTQVLGAKKSQELATRFLLSGRVDLYHAFTLAMANVLKPGGVLGLLTSNRFLTVKSGASLRKLLYRRFSLLSIYDLGDTRLFSAAVLPVVVVARKQPSRAAAPCTFDRVYERRQTSVQHSTLEYPSILTALRDRQCEGIVETPKGVYVVERGLLTATDDDAWSLSTPAVDSWLNAIRAKRQCCFADLAKVRVGIKTTADEVFLRDDWDCLPEGERPEPELLRPLLTHHEAGRWLADSKSSPKRVLYPHTIANGKRVAIDLAQYPRAAAYLGSHADRLARRKYLIDAGRQWYEIWVPQNPDDWHLRKIAYPDIAEFPRFFLDSTGAIVNGDCYWIALNEGVDSDWLLLMLAVANSSLITRYYDAVYHNKLYSGRRRFMTQYVNGFPLPALDSVQGRKIVDAVSCSIRGGRVAPETDREIDCLVWSAFGLGKEFGG